MSFKDTLWSGAMKLGGMAVDYIKQNGFNNNSSNSPFAQTLKQKLGFCTYDKNVVPDIIQLSLDFFKIYPSVQIETKTFEQGYNSVTVVLEYKVLVEVYKGERKYPVECRILLSKYFPNQSPIIRIVNIDTNKFQTNPFYESSTSKVQGNSYILNPLLISVKSWNRYNSKINDVVNDAISIMSSHFPFYKKSQGGGSNYELNPGFGNNNQNFGGWNDNNQNSGGWNDNNPPFRGNNNNFGNNNYNNNNNNNFNGNNNAYNNNNNGWGFDNNQHSRQQNQWSTEQNKNKVQNPNSNWFGTKQLNSRQQKIKQQIDTLIIQAVSIKQQIQLMVKCNNITQKQYDFIQRNSIINQILTKQIDRISNSIDKMKQLLKRNQQMDLEQIKLIDLVQPVQGKVSQLLELTAENKTQHDMYIFLEGKFTNNQINLETFMRLIRKVEQQKFMSKYMIKKIISQIRK